MIVDDMAFMRQMLKLILVDHGFSVICEAENGKEAINMYKNYKPDVVTMDISMPVMDGIEALKGIKGFDMNAKIVMCSAIEQQKIVFEAITAGAKDFVIKPFRSDRVVEALLKAIE